MPGGNGLPNWWNADVLGDQFRQNGYGNALEWVQGLFADDSLRGGQGHWARETMSPQQYLNWLYQQQQGGSNPLGWQQMMNYLAMKNQGSAPVPDIEDPANPQKENPNWNLTQDRNRGFSPWSRRDLGGTTQSAQAPLWDRQAWQRPGGGEELGKPANAAADAYTGRIRDEANGKDPRIGGGSGGNPNLTLGGGDPRFGGGSGGKPNLGGGGLTTGQESYTRPWSGKPQPSARMPRQGGGGGNSDWEKKRQMMSRNPYHGLYG